MTRYIAGRVLWIIPRALRRLFADVPAHALGPGRAVAREKALPAPTVARLNIKYGLDDPLPVQYINWATSLLRGDLGPSFKFADRSVNDIVGEGHRRHRPARHHGLPAVGAGRHPARHLRRARPQPLAGLPLDRDIRPRHRHAHVRRRHPPDPAVLRETRPLPTGGWKGSETWILPTVALAGFPIAVIARYTRASMLEVTRKDYIRTAHSKGVNDWRS